MATALERIDAPIRQRLALSGDGTPITYFVAGRGPRTWVLPPGLGTPLICWKHVIERFADELTIVTWSLRGTFGSGTPDDPTRLTVEDHADDLAAVVSAEGLERYVLGGWSLGVQTSLEHYHRNPQAVEALILINGAYEHVLQTAFFAGFAPLLKRLIGLLARAGDHAGPLMSRLVGLGPALLPRLGLVRGEPAFFAEIAREFATLQWGTYLRMTLAINAHSAAPYLDEVRVPTLITAGDADVMTPVDIAHAMQRRIAGSELVVFAGGTHYTIAEMPEAFNEALAGFFAKLGSPSEGDRDGDD